MIRYRVELDGPERLHAHQFHVTLSIDRPAAEQTLSLPVWIPGSYLVREFARHVSHLEARQGKRRCELVQRDKASWTVACRGSGTLTLSYRVYAFDASVRTAWLDAQRGFFNGTSLFLRVHGREAEPHRFTLGKLPKGWQVATAARQRAAAKSQDYEAADYDELVDHPVELGRFWRGSFKAHGVPHEFVVAGALPGFDGERLLADAKRVCEAQIALWHARAGKAGKAKPGKPSKPPFARYVFLLNAVDDAYGGLEHRASTALIANRRDLPRAGATAMSDGYATLLGLVSHEYFHSWNVKRLKPAEFARLDYTQENYTQLLWFFEGFTSYYDDLVLVRAGLIDAQRYLRLLAKTINQVRGTPGRAVQSVAEASFDAWVKYYRPEENSLNATVSYYTLGALVALAFDLTLRSEGRGSLDDVLRLLWTRSAAERPDGGAISEDDIAAALAAVGGRSYARELASWVHGRGEPPLRGLLARVGIAWSEEQAPLAQRLGARVSEAGGSLKLQAVLRGGTAERTGLAAGDELVALDGWRIRKIDDLAALGAFERPLPLLAARDQRLLSLTLPAAERLSGAVTLTPDPAADAGARAQRAAWLGGA